MNPVEIPSPKSNLTWVIFLFGSVVAQVARKETTFPTVVLIGGVTSPPESVLPVTVVVTVGLVV